MRVVSIMAGLALALSAAPIAAHGGKLNPEGCHNDRKNGGYHCHRGPARAAKSPGYGLTSGGGGGAYANCTAARAAGAAPVRRGTAAMALTSIETATASAASDQRPRRGSSTILPTPAK